ncbi:MAG TPA: nitroreductase/quinone reductase family protein [Candidatus Limnocylindrales bacterium]|nr:nitroreductase/quinone reductase family protein [Candidatus Limnocylindrales bacterium]
MSFAHDDLRQLAATEEVEIETQAPNGAAHRTTIWVVVDRDEVFVRSFRGPTARWYREARANPAVAIHVQGRRLSATAIAATDPDSIERVSAALWAKYPNDPATKAMVAPAVLDTTLRLEPT